MAQRRMLGPGWSSHCNTPFRRHKTWVHEGGINTSLIVHWPKGIKAHGELRTTPGHVIDFAPTFLDAANVPVPADMQGRSLLPLLKGERPVRLRQYPRLTHEAVLGALGFLAVTLQLGCAVAQLSFQLRRVCGGGGANAGHPRSRRVSLAR